MIKRNRDFDSAAAEELAVLGQQGDEEAVDCLLEKYKPLVLRISRARYLAGGDKEDLIQEGMIGLYRAIRDYDPGREVPFHSFAAMAIDRQMLRAIEASNREKNRPLNNSVLLEEAAVEQGAGGFAEDPETYVLREEGTEERMARLIGRLSPFEEQVITLYLEGLSVREIAASLKRPVKSVDNAFQRIRRKTKRKF